MTVVFCQCKKSDIISRQVSDAIQDWFSQNQIAFTSVEDLCGLAARKDARMQCWATDENTVIIACFERAVRWLFAMADAELETDVSILNQRSSSASEIIDRLKILSLPTGQSNLIADEEQWIPWFPVMDYSRCTNCRQCLNFCLFGVYAPSENGKVEVVRPANCKTGCPACSRVCPSTAIIFAKYTESPFNGDIVDETKLSQLKSSGDYKKWVTENLQKRLQMRNQMQQK